MREKLIELIFEACEKWEGKSGLFKVMADHLIANDVLQVVRCKECKHCATASWGEKFCKRKQADGVYVEMSNLREEDFCSYGERREGE